MNFIKTFSLFVTVLSLIAMEANGQDRIKKYEAAWKEVENFVKKGLPQSALTEVKKIYQLAKKEKQDAQVIKSLVYMTGLQSENRENNEVFSIREIEKEIAGSKEPVSSILNSLLAEMYWHYYQLNRWNMYRRTKTADFKKDDIATWGTEDFHRKIGELYLKSIQAENQLKQTRLASFDAIIVKGNVRHLRPTLYDLLAQRALDYFKNDERDIAKPAYAFEIDQGSAFDPAADFIHRKFDNKNAQSLQYQALLVYQKLIAFHLKDTKPDALIDADIQRLEFVRAKSVHPDKDKLYFNAINHIAHQYGNHSAAAQAWYLVANYYEQQASGYKPFGDTAHRYARLKAKEICEKVLLQKDSSEGKINCLNLLNQINTPSLQFSVEKVNVPGQPFRALVEYRNFNLLYLRVIKPDDNLKKQLENQYEDKYWPSIIAAKPIRSWELALPATNDLQQHAVEIKVDGLPSGEYLLMASTGKDPGNKKATIGARIFYVSNISFVSKDDDFFVLNRDNGQPMAGASVQVWEQQYDYKQSRYVKEKRKLYATDVNGFFRKEKQRDEATKNYRNYSYLLDITHGSDRLFMNDLINDYYYQRSDESIDPKTSVFLFTDRSLYRPGQTVYFKGIVLDRHPAEKKALTSNNYETTVILRDANYQDIDSVKLKTNEFGSFSGKFQLPQSGLNGSFSIYTRTDEGHAGFNVEEYKRPKFFVEYEALKGTYKVNDTIKVTGVAKAYAGNNIDGGIVKYRVVRQARFIYPWLFWKSWFPPAAPMEIAHGETTTDKDGKFVVAFSAIPDLTIDKKMEPVFDYTVYADVTDINGETRSGEHRVTVGYKSLLLKTTIPTSLPVDSLKTLKIRTENMNGEFEAAIVNVRITGLNQGRRLIRSRYWDRPDQFVMSKDEYIKNFPYDEYDNETDPKSWEKGEKVFENSDSLKTSGVPITIGRKVGNGKFVPGFYVIEISTRDKDGAEVKDVKYIELYDEKSNQLNVPQYLWAEGARPIEPGEKTIVQLGTSADNLFVVQQLDKSTSNFKPQTSNYSFMKLNNEKKAFEFSATEADRGGYGVDWVFVKHNRVYQFKQIIEIPWTNKDLSIEYATYRDKTLPGSEEKWKLKITGYKNEKLAAELLASMYDASLDQFYLHQWYKPYIWPPYLKSNPWLSNQNFLKVEAQLKGSEGDQLKPIIKDYDGLFWSVYGLTANGFESFFDNIYGPRLMRLPKPVFRNEAEAEKAMAAGAVLPDSDGDGTTDQFDNVQNSAEEAKELKRQKDELKEKELKPDDLKVRKNFNETAFFFPDLKTDSSGTIEFSFTIPEALTEWKFQALAHTKEGALGYSSKEIITQKELMVQPNAPRFLREGDKMEFSAKIVNLTNKELTGQAKFQLLDATTNQPVDGWFGNMMPEQFFTVAAGQSEAVKFPMTVPYQFNKTLVWRIVAKAEAFSDGEENALPVLTNRILVTETMPLTMKGEAVKSVKFDKLIQSGASETLQHYALTVEYTTHPAWYAIQALPYLMEFPYDCAEQTWNRYYANSLASFIGNSSPRIKQIFEQWKSKDTAALLSNLQKNQELKAILLEETPWVLQAKSEAEQKKNIALLFDMVRMSQELNSSYEKLKQMQSSNGGFVWFKGGPDDRYMTQYIVSGIGHLKRIKGQVDTRLAAITATAIPYLDQKIKEDYDKLIKNKTDLKKYMPGYYEIQYLYMRSFFPEYPIPTSSKKAYDYFRNRSQLTWTKQTKYMQGMIVLALGRTGDKKTPAAILKSLKETSITHEELGRYWKDAKRGWFWHEAPIERQALLIEAFSESGRDTNTVDELRTWLLKNKQTNRWESTKATAEACYALLLRGTQWRNSEPTVRINLGSAEIRSADNQQEAGTGYFKKTIDSKEIRPEMGNISVAIETGQTSTPGISTGAVYWQYFEDLDKITPAATPLNLVKKLFVEKNTDRGPVLTPVNDGTVLKVGDKIKVRIELRVDREMEYVHMKDMRASAMEPVNVLSSYKWQGGLGYYESTKDASTNFFFSNLRKGTYVFEYPLFATHSGNFSNGITIIQCMYAPEFSAHSEGVRINVE